MSLMEQLAEIGNDIIGMGMAQRGPIYKSPYPDKIHLLANWAMTDKDKIYLSPEKSILDPTNTSVPVQFGSIMMYPPLFRNGENLNYIKINPTIDKKEVPLDISLNNPSAAIATYCYAIEVELQKKVTSAGGFDGYSGLGAVTLAYNHNAANKAEYIASDDNFFPFLCLKGELKSYDPFLGVTLDLYQPESPTAAQKVYMEGGGLFYHLKMGLRNQQAPADPALPIFEYFFQADSVSKFTNDEEDGGISGEISEPSSILSPLSDTIGNLQIIFPAEEDKFVTRRWFIEHFAFPYSNMNQIILTTVNAKEDFSQYTLDWSFFPEHGEHYIIASRTRNTAARYPIVISSPPVVKIQPVFIDLEIYPEPLSTARIARIYDNTRQYILKLMGGIRIQFTDKETYVLSPNSKFIGNIIWTYQTQTIIPDSEGYKITTGSNLKGVMVAWTGKATFDFENSNYKIYQLQLEGLLDLLPSSVKEKSIETPSVEDVKSFAQSTIEELRDIMSDLGVVVSYVLYKPNPNIIKGEYNELIFFQGFGSPEARNQLISNLTFSSELVLGNTVGRFRRFITNNKVVGFPSGLLGRVTSNKYLNSWDMTKAQGSNIGLSIK